MQHSEYRQLVGRVNRALRFRQVPIIKDVWEPIVAAVGEEAVENGMQHSEVSLATAYLAGLAEYWGYNVRTAVESEVRAVGRVVEDSQTARGRGRKPAAE